MTIYQTIMKKRILPFGYVLIFVALFGCGQNADAPKTLAEKEAKLAELRTQLTETQTEIQKLEMQISAEKGGETKALKPVEVIKTEPIVFQHFIEVQGNVESDKNVTVNPEFSGTIIRKNVQEGQMVSKGQVLAEIDAQTIKAQIAELKTRLELATTSYERQKNLWDQKIGSEMQFLQAKNQKESLERSIESVKAQLDKTFIKSPISGTIDEIFVNEGEIANPAMPFCRVVNLASVQVNAEVSEAYTKEVKKGDKVTVSFPNLNIEKEESIDLVGQFINPQNRTFRIRVTLDNSGKTLKPNSMAVVKIKDFEQKDVLTVPSNIIQQSASGENFLFVARKKENKNTVQKVVVKTGMTYQGQTMIQEGLNAGDQVIIKGYNEVTDGEEVAVVKS